MKPIKHTLRLACAALFGPVFFGLMISSLPINAAEANTCPCFTTKMMTRSCTGGKKVSITEGISYERDDRRTQTTIGVVCSNAQGYVRYGTRSVSYEDDRGNNRSCDRTSTKSMKRELNDDQINSCVATMRLFRVSWKRFMDCGSKRNRVGTISNPRFTSKIITCNLKPIYLKKGNYLKSK
jgi:hypothetical protein